MTSSILDDSPLRGASFREAPTGGAVFHDSAIGAEICNDRRPSPVHYQDGSLSIKAGSALPDVMLGLVLVLCLVLCAASVTIAVGSVDLESAARNQQGIIESVARAYGTEPVPLGNDSFGIYVRQKGNRAAPDLEFHNTFDSQRVTFSDELLFQADDVQLLPAGRTAVGHVGAQLEARMAVIKEIQVRGHADVVPSRRYPSNVELAAGRAIAVFTYLQNVVGIDPAEHAMSVASFGQYLSVQRSAGSAGYSMARLLEDNASDEQRDHNRRIELLITYRR